jgi:tol-pal system protein YbgF
MIQQKELEIEDLHFQLSSRNERINQLEQTMKNRGSRLSTAFSIDDTEITTNYEQALESYYAREYDAAIYVFNSILETNPNHRLAGNCQYWIGECYFGKKHYDSAVDAFKNVFKYNESAKKDDALVMMGRSYLELGDKEMAIESFTLLMQNYPNSEFFKKAEEYYNAF